MKKRIYDKPSVKVVALLHQGHLLQTSGQLNNPDDYTYGGDPFNV